MKKVVLTYGLITGVLFSVIMAFGWSQMSEHASYGWAEVLGFLSMFVALSVIFFAIRKHRSNLGGAISFQNAFLVGMWISIIVTVGYVVAWMVTMAANPGVMDQFFEMQIKGLESSGLPADQIAEKIEKSQQMKIRYVSDSVYRIKMTILEIFPIAIGITLISSLILSTLLKKNKNPESSVVA